MTILMVFKLIGKLIPLMQEVILGDRTIARFVYEHILYLFLLGIITTLSVTLYNTRYELKEITKLVEDGPIPTTPIPDKEPISPLTPTPTPPTPKDPVKAIRTTVDTRSLIRSRLARGVDDG